MRDLLTLLDNKEEKIQVYRKSYSKKINVNNIRNKPVTYFSTTSYKHLAL